MHYFAGGAYLDIALWENSSDFRRLWTHGAHEGEAGSLSDNGVAV